MLLGSYLLEGMALKYGFSDTTMYQGYLQDGSTGCWALSAKDLTQFLTLNSKEASHC